MPANNYTILLSAKINEASLQANINSLANKYTVMLKGAISGISGAINPVVNTGAEAVTAAQARLTAVQEELAVAQANVISATNALTVAQTAQVSSLEILTNAQAGLTAAETEFSIAQAEVVAATNILTEAQIAQNPSALSLTIAQDGLSFAQTRLANAQIAVVNSTNALAAAQAAQTSPAQALVNAQEAVVSAETQLATVQENAVSATNALTAAQTAQASSATKLVATQSGVTVSTNAGANATQKQVYSAGQINEAVVAEAKNYKGLNQVVNEYGDAEGNLSKIVQKYTNDQGNAVVATTTFNKKTGEATTQLKETAGQLNITADRTKNFSDQITNNIAKVVQWAIATAAIYGTLKQIQNGIKYIEDLNKSLTNISIVTGMTQKQTYQLGQQYNELAKQMGVTTQAIADGSLEWFRQGKTVEETGALMKQTLMLATLGNLDVAQSTEYLTSIINGFQLKAEDVASVLDKLVNLDNNYATSVGEIATAMQTSSAVANQAKVSFDQLAAMITVISSVTRISADTVGQSLKTMLTRMEQIKIGQLFEDDTTSINQVTQALHSVGIEMMQDANTFRPMGDVLNDLGNKWDTLTQKQQNAIAGTIAGIRQVPQFLVLMQNWNQVIEAQGIETDSAGLAQQRYGIYLAGVEAQLNKTKAAWEGVWQTTISSGAITWFAKLGETIANAVNKMGGLVPIVLGVVTAVALINFPAIIAGVISLTTYVTGLASATALFGVSLATVEAVMPIIGVLLLAAGAIWAIVASNTKNAADRLQELNQEIDTYSGKIKSLESEKDTLQSLATEYDNLREKTSKSADEQKRFLDIQQQIYGILPQVAIGYDSAGNAILDATVPMRAYINLQQQQINNDKIILGTDTAKAFSGKVKTYQDEKDKLDALIKDYELYKQAIKESSSTDATTARQAEIIVRRYQAIYGDLETLQLDINGERATENNLLIELSQNYASLTPDLQEYVNIQLSSLGYTRDQIIEMTHLAAVNEDTTRAQRDNTEITQKNTDTKNSNAEATDTVSQAMSDFGSTISSVTSAFNDMHSAEQKLKDGTLTAEDIWQLISAHEGLIKYLSIENGQLVLTAEGMKAYADATISAAIAHAMLVNASAKEIAALVALRNQLESGTFEYATPTGGSGGANDALNAAKKAVQDEYDLKIKNAQAEKDALKEKLDGYKKIIDARKAILKSMKDEADYQDTLRDKEKSVSKIQQELLAISLDNSEEAQAKRLDLQDQLATAQEDLNKTQADRTYDIEVEALDKEYAAYEDMINGQMDLLDKFIQSLKDALQSILDQMDKNGAKVGGGGGGSPIPQPPQPSAPTPYRGVPVKSPGTVIPLSRGGVIKGGITGKDSVPVVLMPGEGVLKKSAVDSIGIDTINRINSGVINNIPSMMNAPSISNVSNSNGDIKIDMPINVAGNLDKSVLPNLEQMVDKAFEKMNRTILLRGYKRTANTYSS